MSLELWLAFCAASIVILMIPGPTVLLTLSYALSQGRRVALATAAGVALGDFAAMTASMLGLGALLMTSASLFIALKWVGAAYLIWLGVGLLRAAPTTPDIEADPVAARSVFSHAFLVTALNPKSIAFFVAFAPQFVDPGLAYLPQITVMIATFVGLATLNIFVYALAASHLRTHIRRPSTLRWLNRAGGASLISMGAATAVTA